MIGCALLTGAFEMGDPFHSVDRERLTAEITVGEPAGFTVRVRRLVRPFLCML